MNPKPFILERKDGEVRMPPGVHRYHDHLVLEADERGVKMTVYRGGGKTGGGWRSNRDELVEEVDAWCGADADTAIRKAVDDWLKRARALFAPEPDERDPSPEPAPAITASSAPRKAASKSAPKRATA